MDVELQPIRSNGSDGASYPSNDKVTAGNGAGAAYRTSDAEEGNPLLAVQSAGCNGETSHAAENHQETGSKQRIKRELNEIVFWKVKLWMVFIFILLFFVAVIIISLVVCSALHEDVDEKFDPSSFTVPLRFNGSFQLPNLAFAEELSNLSSNKSQALIADLQEKITDPYRSSPALERYFSKAVIYTLRPGSVIADYELTFLMPEEEQEQLRNFTLSREVVYNVFRQFLYDQEPDGSGPMYIDPRSLNMSRGQL